jgi:ABC-2 type transport system ATP-binding protein
VSAVERDGARVTFRVAGDLDPVVKAISRHRVVDLEFARPTLEEVFLTYYEEGPR